MKISIASTKTVMVISPGMRDLVKSARNPTISGPMKPPTATSMKRIPLATPIYFAPILGMSIRVTITRGAVAEELMP